MILRKWNLLPEKMKNEYVKQIYNKLQKKKIQLVIKRIFDIIVSFVLLILLSPLIAVIAIMIKKDSKGPVFYRQERITQYGKKFRIFKFRTMVNNADKIGTHVTGYNDNRITKVGKKIRDSRLDEIPQLINVLKGEMSFVGTRPEAVKYVEKYTPEMMATLLLPAGITSEASIAYKDEAKLLETAVDVDDTYINEILPSKMKYNIEAMEKFNILYDLKIMIKTVVSVLI